MGKRMWNMNNYNLIEKIETGVFKDLQLCSEVDGRQQQYKICLQPPSEE